VSWGGPDGGAFWQKTERAGGSRKQGGTGQQQQTKTTGKRAEGQRVPGQGTNKKPPKPPFCTTGRPATQRGKKKHKKKKGRLTGGPPFVGVRGFFLGRGCWVVVHHGWGGGNVLGTKKIFRFGGTTVSGAESCSFKTLFRGGALRRVGLAPRGIFRRGKPHLWGGMGGALPLTQVSWDLGKSISGNPSGNKKKKRVNPLFQRNFPPRPHKKFFFPKKGSRGG